MRSQLAKTLIAALPLVGALWLAPPASADDNWWRYGRDSYRPFYGDRHDDADYYGRDRYDDLRDRHAEQHNKLEDKHERRMDRLAEKQQKALRKAYRKHDGNIADPDFQERQGEIAEKYARKRNKVERNLGERHREGHRALAERYEDYDN
jgi:hypothetical protein